MAVILQPRRIGRNQTSIPPRIQIVIINPQSKIVKIIISWGSFFLLIIVKSSIAPIVNKHTVADKIAVLLNSGGKSGVPRTKAQNQAKVIPTEALAIGTPDLLCPIK
jgi:hypothetical protein